MKRTLACGGTVIGLVAVIHGQAPSTMSVSAERTLVDQYCVSCHNDQRKAGDFSWTTLDLAHVDRNAAEAEKVVLKLRAGLMPPAGARRPGAATLGAFLTALETSLDAAAAANPNPGRPRLQRLSRTQYENSVRDLLGVDVDVNAFLPGDPMTQGFDNMSDVLTSSPALMAGYIRTAGEAVRMALGDPSVTPYVKTYTHPRTFSQLRHVEGTPFGTRGGMAVTHHFPADGEYVFRLTFYYSGLGVFFGQSEGKGHQIEVAVNGERVALMDINPMMKLTDDLRTPPIRVKAGPQIVSAAFIQKHDGPVDDSVMPYEHSLQDVSNANVPGITALPHLRDLGIDGPYNVTGVSETPGRRKIFTCRPTGQRQQPATRQGEVECARKVLAPLARLAYRRPVGNADVDSLLGIFQVGRKQGDFDAGIRAAVQAILANPEFIFRFERTPASVKPGTNYRISDLDLASRLSYFLWSSAPDEELLTIASQNRLRNAGVLEQQVRRMIADPRSMTLATNFAVQWLHLRELKEVRPDAYQHPDFDKNLADSMRRETELFFDSIVRGDRRVLDLLEADYTFVDERLAKHYGIPNVLGTTFRRVTRHDENRRGLLGHGSVLTVTSLANRTSPVIRGKWVMDVILGTPPPSPPPNVPPLKENAEGVKHLPVRERLQAHRANPTCAACHRMIDPIGFALENFDAVGVWRIHDSGRPIDASGELIDGTRVDSPAGLRQALVAHADLFIRTFTRNLLMYGLGRVLEPYDMPVVRAIARQAAADDYRFSSFVLGIVTSTPFQMRRAETDPPVKTDTAARGPDE